MLLEDYEKQWEARQTAARQAVDDGSLENTTTSADADDDDEEDDDLEESFVLAHSLLASACKHLMAYADKNFKPTAKHRKITEKLAFEIGQFVLSLESDGLIEDSAMDEFAFPKEKKR